MAKTPIYKKMDKRLKTRWIKALLSGKYKQGRGALKTPKREYCCLGVLCDITKGRQWGVDYSGQYCVEIEDDTYQLFAPDNFIDHDAQRQLSAMNDGEHVDGGQVKRPVNFTRIAKWIERHL